MSLSLKKIAPLGAEIVDAKCDLLLEDESIASEVMDLLEEHGVLIFRGLDLDDAQHVAFSRRLGATQVRDTPGYRGEFPELFTVSLYRRLNDVSYMKVTFGWHVDGTTLPSGIPPKASLLSARALPSDGSQTQFASTYAAYDRLSGEEQARFEGLKVWHTLEAAYRNFNPDPPPEVLAEVRDDPVKLHPLVWTHRSGRKSLVIGVTATGIEGMSKEKSMALLDEILARGTEPSQIYTHEWQIGDLVIWDNRGVLHRAVPYAEDSGREMHRVTLVGDEPIR